MDRPSFSNLLKPQLEFRITLRIPENYYRMAPELPQVFILAMEFLISEQVPFRLFYNFTQFKTPLEPLVSRQLRFVQNQAVWLVFANVRNKSNAVDLHQVVKSCLLGNRLGWAAIIQKDLIQLIVDESAIAKATRTRFDLTIARAYVPLYFVVLFWSGTGFTSRDAFLLRDTCRCDSGGPFTRLGDYFLKLGDPDGIEGTQAEIRKEKRNFGGRKIRICPSKPVNGTWESHWKHFFPFSFRAAHANWTYAFVGLFDSFSSQHNFTFDFEVCIRGGSSFRLRGHSVHAFQLQL